MTDPDFYRKSGSKVSEYTSLLEALKQELAQVYARWEELEAMKG